MIFGRKNRQEKLNKDQNKTLSEIPDKALDEGIRDSAYGICKNGFYDVHCHILPGIDDGAEDGEMSLALINEEKRQGCKGIICTPHYYPEEKIDVFLERRRRACVELLRTMRQQTSGDKAQEPVSDRKESTEADGAAGKDSAGPKDKDDFKIALGAEVAYYPGIANNPDISKLCMGKSRYMLLEMPFTEWSRTTLRDVRSMITNLGIRPVIAHLERFYDYTDRDSIEELLELPVLVQVNAGPLTVRGDGRKRIISLIKSGRALLIGSDTHNIEKRPPNIPEGIRTLYDLRLHDDITKILKNNEMIFKESLEGR